MRAGAASIAINNEIGTAIQGASVNKVVSYVRDDLEANAVYVEQGGVRVVLISCDVVALTRPVIESAQQQIADRIGINPHDAIIACTHTHAGPSVLHTSYHKKPDAEYQARLCTWLADVAEQAATNAQPAKWRFAQGEARIGFNRRLCFADGSHSMNGDATREDYAGLEGEADPRHTALLAEDQQGKPLAVIHANSAHPTLFYGQDFLSADYPGEARKLIREAMGDLPVLYLNGPFGDVAPQDCVQRAGNAGREQRLRAMGSLVAGTTMSLLESVLPEADVAVAHDWSVLTAEVRLPDDEQLAAARAVIKRVEAGQDVKAWELMYAHGRSQLFAEFGETGHEDLHVHALVIGPVAIVSHPCELYTQFGLDIKRRSPFAMTIITDCTNGYSGYCPTYGAYLGGGYSADTMYASRVGPATGYQLVDRASSMLHKLSRS